MTSVPVFSVGFQTLNRHEQNTMFQDRGPCHGSDGYEPWNKSIHKLGQQWRSNGLSRLGLEHRAAVEGDEQRELPDPVVHG